MAKHSADAIEGIKSAQRKGQTKFDRKAKAFAKSMAKADANAGRAPAPAVPPLTEAEEDGLKDKVFEYCFKNNVFFDTNLLDEVIDSERGRNVQKENDENGDFSIDELLDPTYNPAIEQAENAQQGESSEIDLSHLIESYRKALAKDKRYEGETFFSQLHREYFEKITSDDIVDIMLSDDDKRNREQILSIINYDPFEDSPIEDRASLYRDLVGMLTDSMRRDIPKQKAAIQVVQDYAIIDKYKKKLTKLEAIDEEQHTFDEKGNDMTQKAIDNANSMIGKVQDTINKLTKENGFSSGKSVGADGRGGLTEIMNFCETRGYDLEAVNCYDIKTSDAMKQVADISDRALLNQVSLQETDYADILAAQAEIVRKMKKAAADALEAERMAIQTVEEERLLKNYRNDLAAKGINLKDIEQIISQSIKMYEPRNRRKLS